LYIVHLCRFELWPQSNFTNSYYFKNRGFPKTANGNSNFWTLKKVQSLEKNDPPPPFIRRLAAGLTSNSNNPLYFWSNPEHTQIWINPKIRFEAGSLLVDVSAKWLALFLFPSKSCLETNVMPEILDFMNAINIMFPAIVVPYSLLLFSQFNSLWNSVIKSSPVIMQFFGFLFVNPLNSRCNYSATSNNTKLVHWPLMGGLLHLVQQGGAWAGCGPAQALPHCTMCNSQPIKGQCTNFVLFDVAL